MENSTGTQGKKARPRVSLLILGGMGMVVLVAAAWVLVMLRPRLGDWPATAMPCRKSELALGNVKFEIRAVKRNAGGSLPIPGDNENVAFWMDDTTTQPVFVLSPAAGNLALASSLKTGDPLNATWADCGRQQYVVRSVKAVDALDAAVFDQSRIGMTVVVPSRESASALVVQGVPPEMLVVCDENTLKIGAATYRVETIPPPTGGTLNIPPDTAGAAYWIQGTESNPVFALSPAAENLALQNSQGEQVIFTRENCNATSYTLAAAQAGLPDMPTLLDQSASGITIFVQASDGGGFVMRGELTGEEIKEFESPDVTAVQAEISLLETTTSADQTTIQVKVSILNTGKIPLTLTAKDVALLVDSAITAPQRSEPVLPREVATGATETFTFTFARPTTTTAILKILSIEYDLEGY